ncbi:unnamed protein product [Alopecurus aequalis]
MLRLMSSAGMAATQSNLHSFPSSTAAPSFRAFSRNLCSSEDKKLKEWMYEYAWFGPRWRMAFEFADIRKKYPEIPAENMDRDMFLKGRETSKFLGIFDVNVPVVIVKADFKGQKVMKRTMLVMGRDVERLEAAAERLNKFRSLLTLLNDLIWNRKLQ